MFALRSVDLSARILGCGDGPASFNATLTARGGRIVSADPLYQFTAEEIRSRVHLAREHIETNTRNNAAAYLWTKIPSIDEMVALRLRAMEEFLADFEQGRRAGRYTDTALPNLPFPDGAFDIALCSHFLFLYSPLLDRAFHFAAVAEMLRVAREVRIFPLLDFDGCPSPHVDAVIRDFSAMGRCCALRRVPYEFLRGAHTMLVIR